MTLQMLERVRNAFREAEVEGGYQVRMSGKGVRTLIECGVLDPRDRFNFSPEAETLVELAERHPGLRLILTGDCSLSGASEWDLTDMVDRKGTIRITIITGTMSPEGFCEDAFWIIHGADEASIQWTPKGQISLYAWWD